MDFCDNFGTIYFSRYVTIREKHSSIVLSPMQDNNIK